MRHTITMTVEAPDEMTVRDVSLWVEQAFQMKWEDHLRQRCEGPHPSASWHAVVHNLPEVYAFYGVRMTWQALLGDKDVKHFPPWPAMPTVEGAAFDAWCWINDCRWSEVLPNFLGQRVVNE